MNIDFEPIQANERSELRETIMFFVFFFCFMAAKMNARSTQKKRLYVFVPHNCVTNQYLAYRVCTYNNWQLEIFLKIF